MGHQSTREDGCEAVSNGIAPVAQNEEACLAHRSRARLMLHERGQRSILPVKVDGACCTLDAATRSAHLTFLMATSNFEPSGNRRRRSVVGEGLVDCHVPVAKVAVRTVREAIEDQGGELLDLCIGVDVEELPVPGNSVELVKDGELTKQGIQRGHTCLHADMTSVTHLPTLAPTKRRQPPTMLRPGSLLGPMLVAKGKDRIQHSDNLLAAASHHVAGFGAVVQADDWHVAVLRRLAGRANSHVVEHATFLHIAPTEGAPTATHLSAEGNHASCLPPNGCRNRHAAREANEGRRVGREASKQVVGERLARAYALAIFIHMCRC